MRKTFGSIVIVFRCPGQHQQDSAQREDPSRRVVRPTLVIRFLFLVAWTRAGRTLLEEC